MAKDFKTVAKNIRKAAASKVLPVVSTRVMKPAAIQIESNAKTRWPVDSGSSKDGLSVKVKTTKNSTDVVARNAEDYAPFIRSSQNGLGGGSPVEILLAQPMADLAVELKGPKTRKLMASVIQKEISRG